MKTIRWVVLTLPLASAICSAGRAQPINLDAPIDIKDAPDERSLRLSLEVAANEFGGKLEAGKGGWVCLAIENASKKEMALDTVRTAGKGFSEKNPSLTTESPYFGAGIAKLTYQFVPARPNVAATPAEPIPPPDEPIVLRPGEKRVFWRRINAPQRAGRYSMKLFFSNGPVADVASSYNLTPAIQRFEATSDSRPFEVIDPPDGK